MAAWSDLNYGDGVLEKILALLSFPDHQRFAAVCRNWRQVVKLQYASAVEQLPWLITGEMLDTDKRRFDNFSEQRRYYLDFPTLRGRYWVGSSFGWVFVIGEDLSYCLLNPFTKQVIELPGMPQFESKIRLYGFKKVVLSKDPCQSQDFTLLLLYRVGTTSSCVVYWESQTGRWSCPSWVQAMLDAIYFRGKFYLAAFRNLFCVSDFYPQVRLEETMPLDISGYLVDFLGDLILLKRKTNYILRDEDKESINACKINLEQRTLSRLSGLGNYAVFVGDCSPIVVDCQKFPVCKTNCVYFPIAWNSLGIYHFSEDKTDLPNIFKPYTKNQCPIWIMPNLQWRPTAEEG